MPFSTSFKLHAGPTLPGWQFFLLHVHFDFDKAWSGKHLLKARTLHALIRFCQSRLLKCRSISSWIFSWQWRRSPECTTYWGACKKAPNEICRHEYLLLSFLVLGLTNSWRWLSEAFCSSFPPQVYKLQFHDFTQRITTFAGLHCVLKLSGTNSFWHPSLHLPRLSKPPVNFRIFQKHSPLFWIGDRQKTDVSFQRYVCCQHYAFKAAQKSPPFHTAKPPSQFASFVLPSAAQSSCPLLKAGPPSPTALKHIKLRYFRNEKVSSWKRWMLRKFQEPQLSLRPFDLRDFFPLAVYVIPAWL